MQPILSILVITHNQLELLKHCLRSVLVQKLNVPFEVIVSDDRSDDGTAEYMAALIQQWKDGELCIQNLVDIVYTRCNSNDCDPKNVSERCGWNKLNVYQHARGKYFVNIDADDYLKSDTIYQAQLDMLMAHPECSMCMQDVWQVKSGESLDSGYRWFLSNLTNEQILQPYDIISKYRALNQCYMTRIHSEYDCAVLYGKFFDDTIITLHHLQFGPVVFLDRADYVWVQYKNSITKTLRGDDSLLENGLLLLHHIRFVPSFASEFMHGGLPEFIHMLKVLAKQNYRWSLTGRSQDAFRETPGRIYIVFSHSQSTFSDRMYLWYVRLIALLYNRFRCTNWQYLYGVLVSHKAARNFTWKRL